MRTRLNIDDSVLEEVRAIQKREGKPLGQLVTELLAFALEARRRERVSETPFRWISRDMGARYDLSDRNALLYVRDPFPREDPTGS